MQIGIVGKRKRVFRVPSFFVILWEGKLNAGKAPEINPQDL